MGVLDVLIHLVNFFLPALGMALLLPALTKLVWWRQVRGEMLGRMAGRVGAMGALVLLVGLLLTGRDGAMLTYAALVAGSAVTVWWTGLR